MDDLRARRHWLVAGLGSAALAALPTVRAQTAAGRSVRWIVPYPAGGGSDFLARTVGNQMSQQMGQSFVIDNKPGGATIVGAQELVKSAPDGQTVMSADNATLVFNGALYRKLPYDPVRDLAPVGLMARFPLILVVNPASGIGSTAELIKAAKAAPGRLSYASPGTGSPHNLAMELLKDRSGTYIVHIPYRGAAPAVQDVLGNQVPIMVIDTAVGLQHIRAGRLVALAVFSPKRLASLPNVATLDEQGLKDIEVFAWQGMVAPAATPREVIARLSTEMQRAIAVPDISRKLQDFGLEPTPSGPEQMAAYVKAEIARWHALIKARGLVIE